MTKTELLTAVKNRIDETDDDDQVDSIIGEAFRYAYRRDLSKLDKRISSAFVPIINGVATLPEDLMAIEKITPSLTGGDRKVGNNIITDQTGMFNVIYSVIREDAGDSEELDMEESLQYLIILYCCAAYYEFKKKVEVANMYTNEYEMRKTQYKSDDDTAIEEGTLDAYPATGSDE